jgi:hypothetical protein
MFHVPCYTSLDEELHEPENVGVFGHHRPVEPTRTIILAIGIVVSLLSTPHLIAHDKHGHAHGEYRSREKVLYLPVAQLFYFRIVHMAFKAAVPAPVILVVVAVVLAIFSVVLAVVTDNIVQRETIVARNEVDALLGFALLPAVNAWAAEQTVGKAPD